MTFQASKHKAHPCANVAELSNPLARWHSWDPAALPYLIAVVSVAAIQPDLDPVLTFDGKPTALWGRFTPPPPELQPGDLLRVEISTNYDMEVTLDAYFRSKSARALNNGGQDETAAAVIEMQMPVFESGRTLPVKVEVIVGWWWLGMWQYEYTWVVGR